MKNQYNETVVAKFAVVSNKQKFTDIIAYLIRNNLPSAYVIETGQIIENPQGSSNHEHQLS